jgi:catechol 2,3-dioxygenase-like lactoylglutathione lyase family enzyme
MSTATTPLVTGVDFVCLPTDDFDASVKFYEETLGLPRVKQWGSMPGMEFQAGNLTLAIMDPTAFGQEFKPHSLPVALQVDDVEAARRTLTERGVEFYGDILDSGICHQAFFRDPGGNTLDLHHRYAQGTPPAAG